MMAALRCYRRPERHATWYCYLPRFNARGGETGADIARVVAFGPGRIHVCIAGQAAAVAVVDTVRAGWALAARLARVAAAAGVPSSEPWPVRWWADPMGRVVGLPLSDSRAPGAPAMPHHAVPVLQGAR